MVDVEEFRVREDSMELSEFLDVCVAHVDSAKDKLFDESV